MRIWLVLLLLLAPAPSAAHEIPANVTILAYVRPEGRQLRLLVRVPLEAMRDVEFPLRDSTYLALSGIDPLLRDAAQLWIADNVRLFENDRLITNGKLVSSRVSLPSDQAFVTYESAIAHLNGARLDYGIDLPWQQAMIDVLLEYPITSSTSDFAIEPSWARLGVRTSTVLRFAPENGEERAFQYSGDPGLVRLDPRWHHAAFRFVKLGFLHILGGIDHLLFLLCLVIPFRRIRPLIAIVTSFTIAHSITLIASAFGFAPGALWFQPLIELLIAISILAMALANILGKQQQTDLASLQRRCMVAFGFGLVHGFGFSFLLRDSMQFAGKHLLSALVTFNVGVEIGQIAVLVVSIPILHWLLTRVVPERMGVIVLSALIAHTSWHWMTARGSDLREYQFQWPALNAAFLAALTRFAMLALIAVGAVWLLRGLVSRYAAPTPKAALAAGDPAPEIRG